MNAAGIALLGAVAAMAATAGRLSALRRSPGASPDDHARALVAAMADGVVVQDTRGVVVECNPAAERILGLSREAPMGRTPLDRRLQAVHRDGTPFRREEHPPTVTLATGRPVTGVLMGIPAPDGAPIWLSASSEPLGDGASRGVVTTFTDVTLRVRAEEDQETLRRLATLVASDAEPRDVFDAIAHDAARAMGAEAAGVFRFEDSASRAALMGAWMADPAVVPAYGTPLPLTRGTAAGLVAATGAPARIGDGSQGPVHPNLLMPDVRVSCVVAAPIIAEGVLWGTLAVATTEARSFHEDAEGRLTGLAEIATLAIVSSDARARLAALASTDHLTGLANRRAFEERLTGEIERARRHCRALSLVVLDLDHFKAVNDVHGHPAGDAVLVEVAQRIVAVARAGETIARIGGEEFAWILPETDGADALAAARRLRAELVGEAFPGVGRVTASMGICGLDDAGEDGDLVRRADIALYRVKANGRDGVQRYRDDAVEVPGSEEQERHLERVRAYASVQALARAVDAKDPSTQRHSERVAEVARRLALESGWPEGEADRLHQAGLVHDAGKIAVPDAILLKPGRLTAGEASIVREHPAVGAAMLHDALAPDQVAWVRGHHERHDGDGYPDGLGGDAIPEGARLLALADAWDAMTVARIYGRPRPLADALAECRRNAGTQFDPGAVRALERVVGSPDPLAAGGRAEG